jgi:hypothetical protein
MAREGAFSRLGDPRSFSTLRSVQDGNRGRIEPDVYQSLRKNGQERRGGENMVSIR